MQIKKSERFSKIFTGMIMMLLMFLFTAVTSYAAEERSKDVVYTAMLNTSLSDHSGDGSKENPYNRFEDALANVSDGGIIYILSAGAFVNDPGNDNPLVIDKAVTIKPAEGLTRASLENRAAGTVLGADVTFSMTRSLLSKAQTEILKTCRRKAHGILTVCAETEITWGLL